jgi:hypothetical protein
MVDEEVDSDVYDDFATIIADDAAAYARLINQVVIPVGGSKWCAKFGTAVAGTLDADQALAFVEALCGHQDARDAVYDWVLNSTYGLSFMETVLAEQKEHWFSEELLEDPRKCAQKVRDLPLYSRQEFLRAFVAELPRELALINEAKEVPT